MAKFSSSFSKVNSETILIIIVIVIAIIVVVYFLNKKQECFGNINNFPQCTKKQGNDIWNSGASNPLFPEGMAADCNLNDACIYNGIPFKCISLNSNQTGWIEITS